MTFEEFRLKNKRQYLEVKQVTGRYAAGVVPFLYQDALLHDVLLLKRKREPSLELYSIITGHIQLLPIPDNFDPWSLMLEHKGEALKDPVASGKMIENRRHAALRELYEEFYPEEAKIIKLLNNWGTGDYAKYIISKGKEHQLTEEMEIVDTTTGYIVSVFSAHLTKYPANPESDVKALRDLSVGQMNPISQFVLSKMGLIGNISADIKFTKLRKVKGLYTWQEPFIVRGDKIIRAPSFAIEY